MLVYGWIVCILITCQVALSPCPPETEDCPADAGRILEPLILAVHEILL